MLSLLRGSRVCLNRPQSVFVAPESSRGIVCFPTGSPLFSGTSGIEVLARILMSRKWGFPAGMLRASLLRRASVPKMAGRARDKGSRPAAPGGGGTKRSSRGTAGPARAWGCGRAFPAGSEVPEALPGVGGGVGRRYTRGETASV